MFSGRISPALAAMAVTAGLVGASARWGHTQTAPDSTRRPGQAKKVDPQINAQFQKADVQAFAKRFESNDREVFARRREILASLGLKPGMAVADIGAGTGLFTRLMAEEVGPTGKVYAVDVSKDFLGYIAAQSARRGQSQVRTIQGTQDSTNLAPQSVDLVFLCDVYHHLENHERILDSIRRALTDQGVLVVVEFDRVEGKSTEFVLKHIRAGQEEFRREIEASGFEPVAAFRPPRLKENFVARFRKHGKDSAARSRSIPEQKPADR